MEKIAEPYEIILVDDASTDNSWQLLRNEATQHVNLRVYHNPKNLGQHPTIYKGLRHATGDWIVVLDCDLQDQPEEILKMWRNKVSDADAIIGLRKERKDKLIKTEGSALFYWILGCLTGKKLNPQVANFGLYHSALISKILDQGKKKFFPMDVHNLALNPQFVEVQHAAASKSSYSLLGRIQLGFQVIKQQIHAG